ncbi:2-oxoadipate dioxygenase/decarboxylase family protein [Niveispirillum fermenti]|uniref:2-oxoadipate dioxygenase/decarboxylase family protein n=1 Tax=Niveispirillum fermenti TaxID=1233113 RepID=UPI003A866BDF
MSHLSTLTAGVLGADAAARLLDLLEIRADLRDADGPEVPRAVLAKALTLVLFHRLLGEVPEAARYVAEQAGQAKLVFDHGALRTVAMDLGDLPGGTAAFGRILEPLGYAVAGIYPLERLRMTGRAYAHRDFPEDIAQYFVSEIYPDRFSPPVQQAARAIFGLSADPLDGDAKALLDRLSRRGSLSPAEAAALLPVLSRAFDRHHGVPRLTDYETVLTESAELAWIATEGNRFNHATDRVPDVIGHAETLKQRGFPMKEAVEISTQGTVRQTAIRAAQVERPFLDEDGSVILRTVPGSFYEFISRDAVAPANDAAPRGLDLRFDSSNAQGIFKMTAAGNKNGRP